MDQVIDHFAVQLDILNKGATKITRSHFKQPEESILNKRGFNVFSKNVTRHKEGILAWKPFYVMLLGVYFALACLAVMKLMYSENVDGFVKSPFCSLREYFWRT